MDRGKVEVIPSCRREDWVAPSVGTCDLAGAKPQNTRLVRVWPSESDCLPGHLIAGDLYECAHVYCLGELARAKGLSAERGRCGMQGEASGLEVAANGLMCLKQARCKGRTVKEAQAT